ncbi:MAG: dihydroneopterin aldolase [Alphaproteobacteria bacterium]|nr:dihydroneopterin aldolase [Alphaproteobacteria bacterium]
MTKSIIPLKIADAAEGMRHVFVRDFVVEAEIGVHAHEKGKTQRIRINLDMSVTEPRQPVPDRLGEVVCYEQAVKDVKEIIGDGHVHLVETLAEKIAQKILFDKRIRSVRVRVEKLEAIEDVSSVGVEIERTTV